MPAVDYEVTSKYFQSSEESCWYAAYCTLFDYKQQPIGQIRERIEKAQPKLDYKDYWNNGLPDEKYNEVRWCLGLSGYRRAYFSQLVDDLDYLGKLMKDYGPFWVAFSVPSEHAVVLCGVDVEKAKLRIMNPAGDLGSAQSQTMTQAEFKRRLGSKDVRSAAQMFVS